MRTEYNVCWINAVMTLIKSIMTSQWALLIQTFNNSEEKVVKVIGRLMKASVTVLNYNMPE